MVLRCATDRIFYVHQRLLIGTTLYSRGDHTVSADEVTASMYCAWLYRRILGQHMERLEELRCDVNVAMARLYVFGLDIRDEEFLSAVIQVMVTHPLVVTTIVVEFLYSHTHQNDPVRRLLIDICVRRPDLRAVGLRIKESCGHFWADLDQAHKQYLEDTISERQLDAWQPEVEDYRCIL